MTEEEYGKVIARNLRRLAFINDKTQIEIAKDLGINQSTLSCWMNGTRTPKMSKIDMLCNYFNCTRSTIMEEHGDNVTFGEKLKPLSDEDLALLKAFDAAPAGIKSSVRILLGLEERG